MNNKDDYKAAYKEAIKFHRFDVIFLSKMHQKSASTVEKWIYEKRGSPQFSDIFELYTYLRIARLEITTGISTIYQRHYQRAWNRGKKYLSDNNIK